jgi:DNA-binding MarR family transcriptional regulator
MPARTLVGSAARRALEAAREAGPGLGALLRLARLELVDTIAAGLEQAGMGEVTPAHYPVIQQLGSSADGARLTDLALGAGVTKPSMSALVDALERAGYVERTPDPDDQRAQRIRLTDRGVELSLACVRLVRVQETRWERRVGRGDVETLRRILRALVATAPGRGDHGGSGSAPAAAPRRARERGGGG